MALHVVVALPGEPPGVWEAAAAFAAYMFASS
jgi:hypothetical protein